MAEQRYEAVRAVIADGETVTDVAARFGVARKTVHGWLARYEAGGLEGLADRSHRPRSCPHQLSAEVEAQVLEWRRWERGRRRSCGSWMWSAGSGVGVAAAAGLSLDRSLVSASIASVGCQKLSAACRSGARRS